jgi:hypothetical protein
VAKSDFKFIGTHAEDLADGRLLVPGETVSLTSEDLKDPHNARYVDEGLLISAGKPASSSKGGES